MEWIRKLKASGNSSRYVILPKSYLNFMGWTIGTKVKIIEEPDGLKITGV